MPWQRITVSTGDDNGLPGDLPTWLVGLDAATLADLPKHLSPATLAQLGLEDTGFLWVADPAPSAPPVVPEVVSRMQLRRQLLTMARTDAVSDGTKLLDQIDAGISSSGDRDLIEYWDDTSDFHRHHPKVEAMLSVFNITSDQADAAWIAAALLT